MGLVRTNPGIDHKDHDNDPHMHQSGPWALEEETVEIHIF